LFQTILNASTSSEENRMNMTKLRFWGVFIFMIALLGLTACERPFQEETAITVPGANQPAPGEAAPFPTEPAVEGEPVVDPNNAGYPAPEEAGEEGGVAPVDGDATGDVAAPEEGATAEEETSTAAPATTNEAGQPIHIVRSGDTIGGIAVLYGVSIEDIAAANPTITNINILDVDQEIIIPQAGFSETEEAAAAGGEGGETAAGEVGERVHIVNSGDTLYSIGLIYGFTVEELQEYNGLSNPNVLKINDEVKIPPPSTGE
jgi:membrane-bound lytic murein transglycosylase D